MLQADGAWNFMFRTMSIKVHYVVQEFHICGFKAAHHLLVLRNRPSCGLVGSQV